MYAARFSGTLQTPLGKLLIPDAQTLRSTIYALFKTQYCYLGVISKLFPGNPRFDAVIDVGANIGDFALSMADRARQVVAIEPAVQNFRVLVRNLRLNRVSNVVAYKLAVHDRKARVILQGASSDMRIVSEGGGEVVHAESLDSLLQRLGIDRVDILKIDTQGHEKEVLAGLRQALAAKRIRLQIVEVHAKRGVDPRDIISLMQSYGYRLAHVDPYLFSQPQLYFVV
jgi:FkbM family methyltransferase